MIDETLNGDNRINNQINIMIKEFLRKTTKYMKNCMFIDDLIKAEDIISDNWVKELLNTNE